MLLDELRKRNFAVAAEMRAKENAVKSINASLETLEEELQALLTLIRLEEKRQPPPTPSPEPTPNVLAEEAKPKSPWSAIAPISGTPVMVTEQTKDGGVSLYETVSEVPKPKRSKSTRKTSSALRDAILLILSDAKNYEMQWQELREEIIKISGSLPQPRSLSGIVGTMVQCGELHLTNTGDKQNMLYRLRAHSIPDFAIENALGHLN